jgi:hypothetical protein
LNFEFLSICLLACCMLSYHCSHDASYGMIVTCYMLIQRLDTFLVFKSMAVGNPAKVVGYTEKEDPSLSMKHGKYCT